MDDEARVGPYLRTLSICHYVYAGLAACGALFGLMYMLFGVLFGKVIAWTAENAEQQRPSNGPPPELFTWMFGLFGAAIMVAALTVALLTYLSARGLARRRHRTLSLVVAGLLCMTGLLGIALGVFTFIVLLKPETERLYAAPPPAS